MVTADFGTLGAARAFPGDLRRSWGAALVEPPSIGALRRAAGESLIQLGQLARPRSGIPTRVVGYFCLEELQDPASLAQMGIRSQRDRQRLAVVKDGRGAVHLLEREVLKPLVRRPGVLEGRLLVRESDTAPWHLLYITDTKAGLEERRLRHTLAYIRYGETQDFPAREGSRRSGGVPAERPQVRVRPVWFQVSRIATGAGRVCWIKGRGERHYAPTLADGVLIPDNFQYSSPPADLANPMAFAAVANASWAHLMAEVYGRRGGGDGVLHTYIRELTMMPLVDPRRLTPSQSDDLVALFEDVARRPACSIAEELQQPDRQALDMWVMRYLFGSDADDAARAVERAIRDLAAERHNRAASGRDQETRAVRRTTFNPTPVAARVLLECGLPPSLLHTVEPPREGGLATVTLEIPQHAPGRAEVGATLLDTGAVLVDGRHLMTAPSDAHSDAVVAILTSDPGFVGVVVLPADEQEMTALEREWRSRWSAWTQKIVEGVRAAVPRVQHGQRRGDVVTEVVKQAGLAFGLIQID